MQQAAKGENEIEVWSHKLQQNATDRQRKIGMKGDIEALADARQALKNHILTHGMSK